MSKLGSTTSVDPSLWIRYPTVARAVLAAARGLDALEDAKYGNGLAILAVHAAIAYTDALTISYRGIKSKDGDHARAADVLVHALGPLAPRRQVTRLRAILNAKSNASYSGTFYTFADGRELMADAEEYAKWAEAAIEARPS